MKMRVFDYHVNLNERGSFYADVRDEITGKTIYEVKEGNELEDGETSLVEDGFMKHNLDTVGLADYLRSLKIIGKNDVIGLVA